jgi:hypothetical protein
MPFRPPQCTIGTIPLQRLAGRATHLIRFKYDMIFEGPRCHSHLSQSLSDLPISLDRCRLVVAIPIDHIGFPFTGRLYDLFDLIAATPLKRDSMIG